MGAGTTVADALVRRARRVGKGKPGPALVSDAFEDLRTRHRAAGPAASSAACAEYPIDESDGQSWRRPLRLRRSDEGPPAVTEPVVMEVVAGARTDDREADLRRLLLRFALLDFDAVADVDLS